MGVGPCVQHPTGELGAIVDHDGGRDPELADRPFQQLDDMLAGPVQPTELRRESPGPASFRIDSLAVFCPTIARRVDVR